ncbi:MAG: ABC transporter ATP-binding protein [Trueperaceae bacterium]|nr:ABC transporter ATP-binding protein [Trueperaceae bacterium]
MTPFLAVDELKKHYPKAGRERPVLDGISFYAEKGEFLAFRGPSGSGKTTLLRLISGIEQASSGFIRIGSSFLHALDDNQRAQFRQRHIGFAFQLFDLLDDLTVAENVALPLILAGQGRKSALKEAEGMLERFAILNLARAMPETLSGGEMQRVSLGRALIHKPDLLLADEPTGSLDTFDAEQALNLLAETREGTGLTILLVTHSARAAAYADRVLTLKEGRLVYNKAGALYA